MYFFLYWKITQEIKVSITRPFYILLNILMKNSVIKTAEKYNLECQAIEAGLLTYLTIIMLIQLYWLRYNNRLITFVNMQSMMNLLPFNEPNQSPSKFVLWSITKK